MHKEKRRGIYSSPFVFFLWILSHACSNNVEFSIEWISVSCCWKIPNILTMSFPRTRNIGIIVLATIFIVKGCQGYSMWKTISYWWPYESKALCSNWKNFLWLKKIHNFCKLIVHISRYYGHKNFESIFFTGNKLVRCFGKVLVSKEFPELKLVFVLRWKTCYLRGMGIIFRN